MINAEFSRAEDRISLKICGHADYAASGADIVCAAVSGIVYALVGYLANECDGLCIKRLCSGEAEIECSPDGEGAMKLACIGLLQIGLSYPHTVDVKNSAWRWERRKRAIPVTF